MDYLKLLKTLTDAPGVSGNEQVAAAVSADILRGYCDEVMIDKRGSVIGRVEGTGPNILLDAHLDQVGFIVTSICDNGFLKIDRCGRADERTLAGLPVEIVCDPPIYGVISSIPPHLADATDLGRAKPITEIAIDTGLTTDEVKSRISLGDRVRMKHTFSKLLGNQVTSGALDDRCGIAVLIRTLDILKEQGVKPNLTVTFSVQEEVGGKGAASASFAEDIDCCIVVDVSFAMTPGCKREETADIGKGPMIGIAPILSKNVSDKLFTIAHGKNIPYQTEVMSGRTGTHADEVSVNKTGIPTGMVSIPLKYMHTPCEIIDTEDLENCALLIAEFCKAGGVSHE